MKISAIFKNLAVLSAFFIASAHAQQGTVTQHAFAIGKGAGVTGYTSLLCGSAQLAVGQAAADPICQTITGDVTINSAGVTALGNIPSATPMAGTLFPTAVAASSTPAAGHGSIWFDSTDKRLHDKNDAGTIATTVVASTAPANQWANGLSSAGAIQYAQINFSNLAGSLACSQTPALTGDVTTSAGSCATTIAANAVTNAKMATMAANTVKCNPTTGAANARDCVKPWVSVTDFGATGDGSTDDTTSITNAIAALPATGGDVVFPCGTYKVSSTIALGNGTSSAASTRYGMVLKGVGNSRVNPVFAGFNTTACVKILWAGSGAGGIVSVNGPLQTWGMQNIMLDCNNVASAVGLQIISAQLGESRNLTLNNCFRGILSTTVAPFGSFTNTDSFHNDFYGTSVNVPLTSGAIGIILTGVAAGTSNTDYNTFVDTWVSVATGAATAIIGIDLQSTDTDHFINTHLSGGNASAACVQFDYSLASSFPSAVRFAGIDPGSSNCNGGAAFGVLGTPGASARANQIYIDEANGAEAGLYPSLVNTALFGSHSIVVNGGGNSTGVNILGAPTTFTPTLTCGTATFTTNSATSKTSGKLTWYQIDFTITAIGTCTSPVTFTLPSTANAASAESGIEIAVDNHVGACRTASASATATCIQASGTNFIVNERWVFSGSYNNQ